MTDSARLGLPLLEAGQAQKEWFHNEALALLDIAVQPVVEGMADAPPATPPVGQCWVVGPAATGEWAGHAGAVAGRTAGGWRFVLPREGFSAWSLAAGTTLRYRSGAWMPDRSPAIAEPVGGAVIDTQARVAVQAILAVLAARGWIA